ncbi:MAG: hypothetical protein R3B49_05470 [Phycisphaerales bacterium]
MLCRASSRNSRAAAEAFELEGLAAGRFLAATQAATSLVAEIEMSTKSVE